MLPESASGAVDREAEDPDLADVLHEVRVVPRFDLRIGELGFVERLRRQHDAFSVECADRGDVLLCEPTCESGEQSDEERHEQDDSGDEGEAAAGESHVAPSEEQDSLRCDEGRAVADGSHPITPVFSPAGAVTSDGRTVLRGREDYSRLVLSGDTDTGPVEAVSAAGTAQ